MKKMLMAMLLSTLMCGTVLASNNGDMLSKEEVQVHTFMSALAETNGYDAAKDTMAPSLSAKMNAKTFSELQRQVQGKFGTPKAIKLASLEKFDQGDRLIYFAAYNNNKLVRVTAVFGPEGKDGIRSITFTPVQMTQKNNQKS